MPLDADYPYYLEGFCALAVTVGEIGFQKLLGSKFYRDNEPEIRKYIWDIPNTTRTKIFYINRTDKWISSSERASVEDMMSLEYSRLSTQRQEYFDFKIDPKEYKILLQMIQIATDGQIVFPRYASYTLCRHTLGGDILERLLIDKTPYDLKYLQEGLDKYLISDLSKIVLEY